ncbi:MAG: MBL fold metallo-hydrolase [Victivallales bacterium]|nr:MBL fold metallo-hydrolase [Victivallales bacterium]
MGIRQYITNIFNVNSYFIEENGRLLIIDPVLTDETRKEIEQHPVDFAVLTHEHYDHIRSVNEINENKLFPVYCGQAASETLKNPRRNLSHYAEFLHECIPFVDKEKKVPIADYSCECDNFLHDDQSISWQGHELIIKETPGHSRGSICILLDGKHLFSGDSIFKSYEAAVRMPGGSPKEYREITLKWLETLPPDTMVHPGHLEPFYLKDRHPFGLQK